MAMNFFEHQHRARRRTWLLVLWFLLAVALIVLALNVAVYFIVKMVALQGVADARAVSVGSWLERPWWVIVTAVTLAVIVLGSLLTLFKLRGGGRAVAEMVDARRVRRDTNDVDERRLVNVVEEMSIASGTPAPAIYVMDEEAGINAFVAGFKPTETVLVVTRGALESLTRDELQGVVGHEYSHVLNGDMRINLRLMGVLAGILVIGQLGGFLLRSLRFSGGRRRSRRGGGQIMIAILAFGAALFVIGYVGLFFGRLIKAGISRQREFLADASAVQFTRNPHGIAGALWKIREHATGSRLASAHAEDMSHMCFGQGMRLSSLLATHPPLDERIRTIDPQFASRMVAERARERASERAAPESPPGRAAAAAPAVAAGFAGGGDVRAGAGGVAASIGNPTDAHVAFAAGLHAAMAPALLDALHAPGRAGHAVLALVLADAGTDARDRLVERLRVEAGEDQAESAAALVEPIAALGASGRLAVIDLAIPSLKDLPEAERGRVVARARALVEADRRVTLFEFVMLTLLRRHLGRDAERADRVRWHSYGDVIEEIRLLLTVLARAGAADEAAFRASFESVMGTFERGAEPVPAERIGVRSLDDALERLAGLSPLLKRTLLTACADCVVHDGRVRPAEAELLRAVAASLDCPMPPLLDSRGDSGDPDP